MAGCAPVRSSFALFIFNLVLKFSVKIKHTLHGDILFLLHVRSEHPMLVKSIPVFSGYPPIAHKVFSEVSVKKCLHPSS